MAAVFRRELGDEAGLPQRLEAMHGVEGGKAGIFGIDEDDAVIAVDGNLMNVEVACGLGIAWHIQPIELLVSHLSLLEDVLQTPNLGNCRKIDALGARTQSHRTHEVALINRESTSG